MTNVEVSESWTDGIIIRTNTTVYIIILRVQSVLPDFVHKEYNTVYIRDVIPMELDDLITMMSGDESELTYWVDGVLFVTFSAIASEILAENEIEGITYVDRLIFTKYPEFSRTVKSSTNFEIAVVNVQNSRLFSKLIHWIKSQPFWND